MTEIDIFLLLVISKEEKDKFFSTPLLLSFSKNTTNYGLAAAVSMLINNMILCCLPVK